MRLSAPRALKEPVFWNSSAFRYRPEPRLSELKRRRAVHGAPDDPSRAADVVGRDGRLGHRAILLKGRFAG